MFINSIKKSTIALVTVALLGVSIAPVMALADSNKNEGRDNDRTEFSFTAKNDSIFNNSAVKAARVAFNNANKAANTAYQTAVKAAKDKRKAALAVAGNDFAKRLAAHKTYISDLLAAFTQKANAKEAALQNYLTALSGIQTVNQAPTANAQSVAVTKNVAKVITLTGTDPQNSALSFFVVTNPIHGTLSGTVPNLTYLPSTDYTGTDSFTFKVNDGSLDSPVATVSITVNP